MKFLSLSLFAIVAIAVPVQYSDALEQYQDGFEYDLIQQDDLLENELHSVYESVKNLD